MNDNKKIIEKGNSEKILVIEEHPIARDTHQSILEMIGYKAIITENDKEGIEQLRNNLDIKAIIMNLGAKYNGVDVYYQMKEEFGGKNDIRILFTSSSEQRGVISKITETGEENHYVDFLRKPMDVSSISKKLKELLEKK